MKAPGRKWALGLAGSVLLHGFALAVIAWSAEDVARERSAGREAAVWGLPAELLFETVETDVAEPDEEIPVDAAVTPDAVEPVEAAEADRPMELAAVEDAWAADVERPVDAAAAPHPPAPAEAFDAGRPTELAAVEDERAVEEPAPMEQRASVDAPAPDTVPTADPAPVQAVEAAPYEARAPRPDATVEAVAPEEISAVEPSTVAALVLDARTAEAAPPSAELAAIAPESEQAIEAEDPVPLPVAKPTPPETARPVEARREPPRQPPKKQAVRQQKQKKKATQRKAQSSKATASAARPASAATGESRGTSGRREADAGAASRSNYAGRVLAHLERHKRFPQDAARRRIDGTVVLTFAVSADGRVKLARLSKGSGHGVLDQEALAMVRRASPFPPIPPSMGRSAMTFTVPVRFRPR